MNASKRADVEQLALVFRIHLHDVCSMFARSCKRGIRLPFVCVLQVLGRLPFDDTNHKRLLRLILQGPTFPVNRESSQEFQDLVTMILKRESLRPNIADIRQAQWFVQNTSFV